MPIYAYLCPACGHGFERLEKMSADASPPCPRCGERVKRLISGGVGLRVRGSAPTQAAAPSGCCGGACGCH